MTSSKPTMRGSRRSLGHLSHYEPIQNVRSDVGDKLRDARELRGLDLFRVERDTKIRTKYLAALEEGEFSDLPGDVYARGFLRNYATYLGLDADEIEEEWREGSGHAEPAAAPIIVGPQPMTMRRKVIFQQSHAVIGVVVIIVLIVASYFGFQLTRYLSYPTLSVAAAGPSPVVVGINETQYVLTGAATPNTTVLIAWNGQDPHLVVADETGHWTYHAVLQTGSNQFDITAKNLDTSHASKTVRLIVIVPSASPTPVIPGVAFELPADAASVTAGSIHVTGTSNAVTNVTLSAKWLGPPNSSGAAVAPPSPGASAQPATPPQTMNTAADGTFAFAEPLLPGRWQLTIAGTTAAGASTPALTRIINVGYKGVHVTIEVKGAQAWLTYFRDGVKVGGNVYPAGWSKSVDGDKSVCVTASSRPGNVYISVNGTFAGTIRSFGGIHVYVDKNGPRNVTAC